MTTRTEDVHGGYLRVPRTRGAATGLALVALGAWGILVPLLGPIFDFGYSPDSTWHFTVGRFWFELLPGIATVVGGLLLLGTANRAVAVFGGYLAAVGGAWYVVGTLFVPHLDLGSVGQPLGSSTRQTLETLVMFTGLGALILFLAGQGLGRFTVRSVRDLEAVRKHTSPDRQDDDHGHDHRDHDHRDHGHDEPDQHDLQDQQGRDRRDGGRTVTAPDGVRSTDDRVPTTAAQRTVGVTRPDTLATPVRTPGPTGAGAGATGTAGTGTGATSTDSDRA